MQYRRLGNTDISVSAVGLGGWGFCGGYDWGNNTLPDVAAVVSAAADAGINFIDTAPVYEPSETLLGEALKGRRDHFIVATKCGLVKRDTWNVHDLRRETIISQCENSLLALQTDYIDVYQVHYPHFSTPLEEVLETLLLLQKQGKIRAIGLCNVSAREMNALSVPVASVQNEFSLLHRASGEAVFETCLQKKISFIGYGTLCGGILSGKYHKEPNFRRADARNYFYKCYKGACFDAALAVTERVCRVAKRHNCPPAQIAISWALMHLAVSSVLTGAKVPSQILQNAQAADVQITAAERVYLEKEND